jgi:hypothetical protein
VLLANFSHSSSSLPPLHAFLPPLPCSVGKDLSAPKVVLCFYEMIFVDTFHSSFLMKLKPRTSFFVCDGGYVS